MGPAAPAGRKEREIMFVKIAMLAAFFAVTVGVGLRFRGRAQDVGGFVLAGRKVGPWLSAFAYGTSYFSAVVFVGYAGQFGWRFGISAVWIGLANALVGSLLAWAALGRRTRLMTRHLGSATMPEFFGARFSSGCLRAGASVIAAVFLVPYAASLYNGLSRLFAMAFDVDFTACIVAMAALTAVYVVAGGYFATAVNDFIQGMVMLAGIGAVVIAALRAHGGFLASLDLLARVEDPAASTSPGAFASFFGPDPVNLLGVMLLTSLGTWGLPQMVQKFYAIESENAVRKGTVISTLFAAFVAGGCYFLGGFGRIFAAPGDVAAGGYDSIIPQVVSAFPPALVGAVIVVVMAASVSTLSSLVMASASTLTLDLLCQAAPRRFGKAGGAGGAGKAGGAGGAGGDGGAGRRQLLAVRALAVAFVAASTAIAVWQYKGGATLIAQLMGVSWGALAGAFLAPLLYGLYWKRATRASVWACFAFSVAWMLANVAFRQAFPPLLQSPINAGAFAMLAGLAIVPAVSAVTRPPKGARVARCFSCYDEAVVVTAAESLGRGEARAPKPGAA
jgi:SSS family solute:Na+ symporter